MLGHTCVPQCGHNVEQYTSMPESTRHLSITNAQSCTTCTTLCRSVSKGRLTSHDYRISTKPSPWTTTTMPREPRPHTRPCHETPTTPCVPSLAEERRPWHGRSRPAHAGERTRENGPSQQPPRGTRVTRQRVNDDK